MSDTAFYSTLLAMIAFFLGYPWFAFFIFLFGIL